MTLLVTEADVEQVLGFPQMGELLDVFQGLYEQAARGEVTRHPRQTVQYPPDRGYYTDSAVRMLPGITPRSGSAALRIYPTFHEEPVEGNGPRVLDYVMGQELLLMYDYWDRMALRAIFSDYLIMNARTAAPTGVATRFHARQDATTLAVIGSGRHAPWQVEAAIAARPGIEEIRIFSPTPANRDRLARTLDARLPQSVSSAVSAREAVDGADVVITVTNANTPVIDVSWLAPGAHVNVIARGEVDAGTVLEAAVVSCSWTEQILRDVPGFRPISDLLEDGRLSHADVHDLADVVSGAVPGRRSPDDLTVFLSQGVGMWDAAIARWVLDRVTAAGLGRPLDLQG